MANILKLDEYDPVGNTSAEVNGLLDWLTLSGKQYDPENEAEQEVASRLGCYRFVNSVKCGGWAGLVRLSGQIQGKNNTFTQDVAVLPRKLGNKRIDLVSMYLECLGNPTVGKHLGEPAVFIWHDQETIECPEEFKEDALIFRNYSPPISPAKAI